MTSKPNSYTIVFTDSGLGGLSIMADFYNAVKILPLNIDYFNIIFFNALQESGNGYNRMSSVDQKIEIFNGALETISNRYQPDQIAIACNTLSSIYPKTRFAQNHQNILEIISCGRSQIKNHIQQFPEIPLFVLATPTTLQTQAYKIENDNVFYISGDNLASLIEFNYMMPELKDKVFEMFAEIKKYLEGRTSCSLFFGCTHYAYIASLFREVSQEFGLHVKNIIDPAKQFKRYLIDLLPKKEGGLLKSKINLKVESQAQILEEEIKSVSSMVMNKSFELTGLLKNYTRLPKTF